MELLHGRRRALVIDGLDRVSAVGLPAIMAPMLSLAGVRIATIVRVAVSVAVLVTATELAAPGQAANGPSLQAAPELVIDADASSGSVCNPIDHSVEIEVGQKLTVAVCLVNGGQVPVAAFNYRMTYDDRLLAAAEVADEDAALDDNPDANAGSTTYSEPDLGGGWDCSGGVGSYPVGDEDGIEKNGVGVAYSGACGSAAGPNRLIQGPLQVIQFTGLSSGTVTLSLIRASVTDDVLNEIGSCRPSVDNEISCVDATVTIRSGTAEPDVTPGRPGSTPTNADESVGDATLTPGQLGELTTNPDGAPDGSGSAPTSVTGPGSAFTAAPATVQDAGAAATQSGSGSTTNDSSSGTNGTTWRMLTILGAVVAAAAVAAGAFWIQRRARR